MGLPQLAEKWFQYVMPVFGLRDLCINDYVRIKHGMLYVFIERWHSETIFFHLPHSEMSITLEDV